MTRQLVWYCTWDPEKHSLTQLQKNSTTTDKSPFFSETTLLQGKWREREGKRQWRKKWMEQSVMPCSCAGVLCVCANSTCNAGDNLIEAAVFCYYQVVLVVVCIISFFFLQKTHKVILYPLKNRATARDYFFYPENKKGKRRNHHDRHTQCSFSCLSWFLCL